LTSASQDTGQSSADVPGDVPDTGVPDTDVPDTDVPDTGVPDTDVPNTRQDLMVGGFTGPVDGFTGLVGMEITELSPDRVVLEWTARPELHQPHGILHGGVYCTAVETAASCGAALWLGTRGNVVGVSNQTDFLRTVREGALTATATPVHRGRLQQVWQVEIHDRERRLVARGQVRLQNIENAGRLGR
jgi:1,4-dihydroxy-2-naphthoyl-CoA hydrolase